ncbi:MAG: ATPase, T2SS/T4P/T4SS family [Armatimonadia bacterium]
MKCEACRELMTAYLKAELEAGERETVEEHLASCAECAEECAGARKVLAAVDQASDEPIVRILDNIIDEAIGHGASDIHIQPRSEVTVIRLRIDGVLHDKMLLPTYTLQPLVNRVKLMAGLSLTTQGVPQDGRIQTKIEERDYDLRVSVVPSVLGETVVMRILDKSGVSMSLDQVQFVGEQRKQLEQMMHSPSGLLLVTGPTGSGKTTTLYAVMHELNKVENNLMSIEDPVEYQFDGFTQIQVNRAAGLDFKGAMRSILRQDPDIILCGEIRDRETAELVVQAAITGHLVLSTLHTNEAISVIRRLLDIGIERFLIAQSLLGATAQRLFRRVCPDCREEYEPSEAERAWLQAAGITETPAKLWRSKGCEKCRSTGYKGRLAVYEVFLMDQEIVNLMVRNAPLEEIEKLAATKVKSMKLTAAEKVVAGETTAAEAMRVLAFLT